MKSETVLATLKVKPTYDTIKTKLEITAKKGCISIICGLRKSYKLKLSRNSATQTRTKNRQFNLFMIK